jgi:hypothetical protein
VDLAGETAAGSQVLRHPSNQSTEKYLQDAERELRDLMASLEDENGPENRNLLANPLGEKGATQETQ